MKLPRSRASRKGRIEIIPMIDVMFFLLATFMIASLSLQQLNSLPVHLPSGKAESAPPQAPITLTITRSSHLYVNKKPVTLQTLKQALKPLLAHEKNHSVIIAADKNAREGVVVKAMLTARQIGVEQFLIAVHKP